MLTSTASVTVWDSTLHYVAGNTRSKTMKKVINWGNWSWNTINTTDLNTFWPSFCRWRSININFFPRSLFNLRYPETVTYGNENRIVLDRLILNKVGQVWIGPAYKGFRSKAIKYKIKWYYFTTKIYVVVIIFPYDYTMYIDLHLSTG